MSHEHAPHRIGATAVDIGPGRGALVVRTDRHRCGTEIELSPLDDDTQRQHVWVLERVTSAGPAFAAVFASLESGTYVVWQRGDDPECTHVVVESARVAEIDWRWAGAR